MNNQFQNRDHAWNIGFIGLGRMGSGIAKNIAKNSYAITVFDIDLKNRMAFNGICSIADSYEEIFSKSDVLLLSLPGSPEVSEITKAFINFGVSGKTVIDLSTSYPSSSIELNSLMKKAGGDFLDSSLTGSPKNAAEGTLNLVVGGDKSIFERYMPLFKTFGKNIFYVGGPGAGNIIKLASNYLSILYISLYAEIISFVRQLDVDPQALFDIVSISGSNSPMFQVNAKKMIDCKFDMTFQMKLALKDLNYIKKLFEEYRIPSTLLDSGLKLFNEAEKLGLLDKDVSEVVKVTEAYCSSSALKKEDR